MRSHNRTIFPFLILVPALCGAVILPGCGKPEDKTATAESAVDYEAREGGMVAAPATSTSAAEPPSVARVEVPRPMPRKIIYTATLEVNTTDFKAAAERLARSVKANDGYIAETTVSGAAGERKNGSWKVRIPAARYEAFLAAAGAIGEVANSSSTSEDVSEEFYDVQARLKNKRVEEGRLIQHLQVSTGKLTEILAVEREISRVRGEIEQMEGRMRFLSHQSDFTTVTINLHELVTLERKPDAPSLGADVRRALVESLSGIGQFARFLVMTLAYMTPWLVILAGIALPVGYLLRKRKVK